MAAKRDLYEVLGISKTADEKTIKKAYRKLAKKYHPDMNPGDKTAEQKEETTKDSIEAVSIKEVLALLMDLEVVDSEVDPSDRKVPTHTQISLLVLMKRLRAAIKSFICKIKMVRCSHYRFIYQPELIQEKVSA